MSDLRKQYAELVGQSQAQLATARGVVVAAAQAEEDAEMMRGAILDALDIYSAANAPLDGEGDDDLTQRRAVAAQHMAGRLRQLHRVRTATYELNPEL